jgi:putative transcriptional regulator
MANYHPDDDMILGYASGALPEPAALLVATHLALCPRCRGLSRLGDQVGGALLETIEPVSVSGTLLEGLLSRIDEAPEATEGEARAAVRGSDPAIPEPLRSYIGRPVGELDWRSHGSVAEFELLPEQAGFKTRLLKIRGGHGLPAHTHQGNEMTLVLTGSFSDDIGRYRRGDVALADASVTHRPVADPGEDCICLAVTDAPLRLTGPIGRWLNPFVRL